MAIYGQEEPSVEDQASVQVSLFDLLKGVGIRSHVQARWLLTERHVLTEDEKSCMLLVMRTLSIVPLNFKVCVLCALCQKKG